MKIKKPDTVIQMEKRKRLFLSLESKPWSLNTSFHNEEHFLQELMAFKGKKKKFMESSSSESKIPAGYTYLGQFIAHDLTFTPSSFSSHPSFSNKKINYRTPSIDLDSVYGGGPIASPIFYDQNKHQGRTSFYIELSEQVFERKECKYKLLDFQRKRQGNGHYHKDSFESRSLREDGLEKKFIPLIPDPRNDENFIVAQIHLGVQLFHNEVVDRIYENIENLYKELKNTFERISNRRDFLNIRKHENVILHGHSRGDQKNVYSIRWYAKKISRKLVEINLQIEDLLKRLNKNKDLLEKIFPELKNIDLKKDSTYKDELLKKTLASSNNFIGELDEPKILFLNRIKKEGEKIETEIFELKKLIDSHQAEIFDQIFYEAQRVVRWHFQWILLEDYLPKVVNPNLLNEIFSPVHNTVQSKLVLNRKFYFWNKTPYIPIEFSAAVFRFGHSMVQSHYRFINIFQELFEVKKINQRFTNYIDWRLFFKPRFDEDRVVNFSRKISPRIAENMVENLPVTGCKNIVIRNLTRSNSLELPSGQDVARLMNTFVIDNKIREEKKYTNLIKEYSGKSTNNLNAYVSRKFKNVVELIEDLEESFPFNKKRFSEFLDCSPLWFYTLLEAYIFEDGERLGPVGGRIVAEVLIGIIEGDKNSFLCQQPDWKPNFFDDDEVETPGDFTMVDLLKIAGVWEGAYVKEKDDCDKSNT